MKPIVLALGYFDAIHLGHRKLIEEAIRLSKQLNCEPAVFTFGGDLSAFLGKSTGVVFTLKEREIILKGLGVKNIVIAPLTLEYLSLSKAEFLDDINKKYQVKAYVCGDDFSFGYKAEGTPADLTKYAKLRNQAVSVIEEVAVFNERVSTTRIKKLMAMGRIEELNELLGFSYFISGVVVHGRAIGRTLGFPTANVDFSKDKFSLKHGVYGGKVVVDGLEYKAVINYGAAPTFDVYPTLEAHLIDFNGDLYGKEIIVCFEKFLREIQKFSSPKELKLQLIKDVKNV